MLAICGVVAGVAALLVSLRQGAPEPLPAVALGWPLILYVERAALVLGLIVGLGGIVDRMLRGDRIAAIQAPGGGGVQLADEAADADETLKEALDASVLDIHERIDAIEQRIPKKSN